jgi:2-oxoglutarate dehydrogenase E2 component (dihydrolipoamide succinyltransferase)
MYLALSYDHRIIDGRDSVSFLVKVKQFIENPVKLLFGASLPEETLLDI